MTPADLAALGARVKPLRFEEGRRGVWLSGLVIGGEYMIVLTGGKGFQVSRGMLAVPNNIARFASLTEAIAAAEADHAARICAALEVDAATARQEVANA